MASSIPVPPTDLIDPVDLDAAAPRHIVCRAGSALCSVPLADARRIVPFASPTRLPGAPPSVLGLLNVRGRMVVAVDVGSWLGSESSASADSSVLLVADGDRMIGLVVSSVEDVRTLEVDAAPMAALAERSSSPVVLEIDTRTLISEFLLEEKG